MRHDIRISSAIVALAICAGSTASVAAQQQAARVSVPVKIEVVVSRFQGDKKTSSLPFTMFINANTNQSVSLRLGVDVPVGTSTVTSGNENTSPTGGRTSTTSTSSTTSHVDYRNVGTSIDCYANQDPDGRFSVNLRVQDSSVFTSDTDGKMTVKIADPMAFRTFTFSNTLTMRDGQTLLWATGADKITGEVLKLEATLTVVK